MAPKGVTFFVSSHKIDFTTLKMPAPTANIITDYGSITTQTSKTMPASGFLIGKAVVFSSDTHAMVTLSADDDNYIVGGIPFWNSGGGINHQVGFCIPVYKGQTIYFRKNSNNQFERVKLVQSHQPLPN